MAKNPDNPKKPGKTPKSKAPNSKASRPDVQPIGPALAELLNPAINRGDAGMGSGTGLQPPPDNSWDRRAGGEAAAHRARASTRGTGEDVAKRDSSSPPPPTRNARGGGGSGGGGAAGNSPARGPAEDPPPPPPPAPPRPPPPRPRGAVVPRPGPRRFAEGGEKRTVALAKLRSANSRLPITAPRRRSRHSTPNWQSNSASPPRRKTSPRWRGRRATRWKRL